MLRMGLAALLSHWRRKPLQLATLLVGLSLATALWSAVQAINGEARASYARAAAVVGQDRLASLAREDGALFDQSVYVDFRRNGWLVSPVLEGEKRFDDERVRIIGIDPLTLPPQARQIDVTGVRNDLLSFITPPGVFYASAETARSLAGQNVRIAEGLPPGTVLMDIGIAQGVLGSGARISRLLLWPDQPRDLAAWKSIDNNLVLRQPGAENDLSRLTDSFHLNLTAFGFLAFAVGLFIVHAAIGLAFEQRRPVFRTLRALGIPRSALLFLLVAELLVVALVAGLAGIAIGYVVASTLLPDVAASIRGLYGVDVPGALSVRPVVWLAGIAIAVLGTSVSAARDLWQVWRMPLLAPAQPRAWALVSERMMRFQGGIAVALLVASALLLQFGSGLAAGFTLLATLLLGASLLLPILLGFALGAGARLSRSALAQWFWADTRQQLPGLSLSLMALLLALAANIGVGTMVSSFRLTFTGWLDQRLASELYVTARNEKEAQAIHDWLMPRSEAVLPIWNVEGRVTGQPVLIYGIADHATYRQNWPILDSVPNVWDKVAQGKGVLINEQLSRRAHLKPDDQIVLPGGHVQKVAGIFSDYGNPKGQVVIGNIVFVRYYPETVALRYAIRISPDKAGALRQDLLQVFNLPSDNVIDQAGIKAFSLKVFERTFAITAALNVLTLGVAGLAMFASLLTLSGMRLPQLAPVWAIGLTRRHLAGLELLRSLALASVTMIAAIPVGLGLAWVLLAVVNVEAFGWRLPMHLFPAEWTRLASLAVLVAVLAAALPAFRLARISPGELLKVFANER